MKLTPGVILILFFFTCSAISSAQQHLVYMNWDYKSPEKEKVFQLWKQYLNQKDNTDTLWCDADRKEFKGVDILKDDLGLSGSLYKISFKCNVISISEMGENFLIRSGLYWDMPDSLEKDKITIFAIINTIAVKQGTSYKLSNYINHSTANWNEKHVGKIIYHYPQAYPFDIFKANDASEFLDSLQRWFGFSADTINYYIPLNCSDGYKMAGFEYYEGEGEQLNLCGFYDSKNNIVYSNAIAGECYKHELIHVANGLFPHAHTDLLCGIAAYIDDAGSRSKPEKFHIKRYREYLKTHPADLNKFYDINYVDEVTALNYVFGAVICNALVRKGGIQLLKKALEANTKKDEDLTAFLKTTLNVHDFNVFFNEEFNAYLSQKDVLLRTKGVE